MADQTANAPNAPSGSTTGSGSTTLGADVAEAGNRLDKERQALSDTIGEARDAAVAEAKDLGNRAAARIGAEAEGIRDEAAAGLSAFSDALRAASSELSGKKVGFAGDMVQQAAGGLESLARSLEGRSPGEMLDSIRAFGRQSPVGFIAGSVLTGFALGRFAAALPGAADQGSDFGTSARTNLPGSVPGREAEHMSGFGASTSTEGLGSAPQQGAEYGSGFGASSGAGGLGSIPDPEPASGFPAVTRSSGEDR